VDSQSPRELRRSSDNRVVAGVCGGLGEYLGVDPVLIRIAAVVLVFVGGAGLVAYLVAWLVMPAAAEGGSVARPRRPAFPDDNGRAGVIAGAVLVAVGGLLLVDLVAPVSIDHRYLWPLLLIVVGATIIARGSGR
jgi:phage shock protein C